MLTLPELLEKLKELNYPKKAIKTKVLEYLKEQLLVAQNKGDTYHEKIIQHYIAILEA